MLRIGVSLPSMHRRIDPKFKETLFTQPEAQKAAWSKSGLGGRNRLRPVVPGHRSPSLPQLAPKIAELGKQLSKTEFRFPLEPHIPFEIKGRQYRKQFGKVREIPQMSLTLIKPLAIRAAERRHCRSCWR